MDLRSSSTLAHGLDILGTKAQIGTVLLAIDYVRVSTLPRFKTSNTLSLVPTRDCAGA